MDYCPPNSTLAGVLHGEVHRCFLDTVTDPFLLVVSLLAGCHQYKLYSTFSTPLDSSNFNSSYLFYLQLFLHGFLPVINILSFITGIFGFISPVHGVDILNIITGTLPWFFTGILLHMERGRQLPVSPTNGHGPVLLIFWTLAFMQANIRLCGLTREPWWAGFYSWADYLDCILYIATYLTTSILFILGIRAPGLLRFSEYGGLGSDVDPAPRSVWSGFFKKMVKLLPYMWPSRSPFLQLRVLFCIVLLAGVRVANVLVPIFYKKIIDKIAETGTNAKDWPWDMVSIWMVLKLLQGSGTGGQGLLNNWRSLLWIKVQQFTTLEIQVGLFKHLHNLSLRWHLGRKTGEVLRIMDRGTNSVNSLLQYLVFNILPTLIDIIVAVVYFAVEFNIYFGLIVFATMFLYLGSTVWITEWRTKFRKRMNESDNAQRARGVDSLLNAETVKYYSMEDWEVFKYREAICDYQEMEWQSMASLQLLNLFQSIVINGGLFGVSLYCTYRVSTGDYTVGDFVLLGTYFIQLMSPLNFLGSVYRAIQESFINMENMFTLLEENIEIQDSPHAAEYIQESAPPQIEFRNVCFNYLENKPVLHDVSFVIAPGTVTAVVGPTGGGKSTLAKLLFRLFDAEDGGIYINDKNIKEFKLSSYRSDIGVVPQDTVLFNDTVGYNIGYGRQGSSQDEIEAAANMAEIHETIMQFPDGYDTLVGERGLKLSGGEKQRVAIARTLLKKPNVVIFDEATSSLDTQTEQLIQNAILTVFKKRTSFIIAHRLSTIMRCDQILVLDQGRIIEKGNHNELLAADGRYAALWNAQGQTNLSETRD